MADTAFVPAAEAAFIAGLSDKQIQRVVDEDILFFPLVHLDNGRRFARLAAVFARFYFELDDTLTATARRSAIRHVCDRVLARSDMNEMLALSLHHSVMDWDVVIHNIHVGFDHFVVDAQARAAQIDHANRLIVEDADIMGGAPVFKGTRVPVDTVLAMRRSGSTAGVVKRHYPFVTPELLEAAEIYQAVHPRRGRPPKAEVAWPAWKLRSRKLVRPAARVCLLQILATRRRTEDSCDEVVPDHLGHGNSGAGVRLLAALLRACH
ncbi:DUF433 domain-containing protein [Caenimonas koreensis]|nr:DUF433 domain-containing protein [Caenimonas koreensis]